MKGLISSDDVEIAMKKTKDKREMSRFGSICCKGKKVVVLKLTALRV